MSGMDLERKLRDVRLAQAQLASSPGARKKAALRALAKLLSKKRQEILSANAEDLRALDPTAASAFRDRLKLDDRRLEQMGESLSQVARLPDPVGEVVERKRLKNGLRVRRVRWPLGVILMIFESRPNVAVESFSLAFKAGNAVILKGGKESARTTRALYALIAEALESEGFPADCVWGVVDPERTVTEALLKTQGLIDVVVPRGGDGLIDYVTRTTRIPLIKNDRGMCHVYVHEDADLKMAEKIVVNAKTQRPGVCNAMETLIVSRAVAAKFLPRLHQAMSPHAVQWFCDAEAMGALEGKPNVVAAAQRSWDTEYLDLRVNCRVVGSLDEALEHIRAHGSRHSEAIVTKSRKAADRFMREVDAAAVYWNASTRFTDGFELGLGGELGISTQKLHVRGPVGLRELTSPRWMIEGKGQVRT